MHSFTVTYDRQVLRDAVRAFMLRRAFRGQPGLWAVWGALVLLLAWRAGRGNSGWPDLIVALVVLAVPAMILVVWIARYREAMGKLQRMGGGQAHFTLDEHGLTITSELGGAMIPWKTVTEAWERPASWMVFTAPNAFFTLPTGEIPADALAFLRDYLPRPD